MTAEAALPPAPSLGTDEPKARSAHTAQVRDAAGLDGLRVHDLRHTAATFWLAAGLTVHAVAELLGHVDAALVLRLYGHALPREVPRRATGSKRGARRSGGA